MDKFVITKNEWHYKMLSWFMRSEFTVQYTCKDFCSYWRQFVLMLVLFSIIVLLAACFVSFLVYSTVYTLILHPFYGWTSSFDHQYLVGTGLTGAISLSATIIILWRLFDWGRKIAAFFESVFESFDDWRYDRIRRRHARLDELEQNPPPPSIFRQWLRNTRDKVCIGIEYQNVE